MDIYWQVIIGGFIGTILLSIYSAYKQYVSESKANNEKQTLATWSIVIGISGIIFAFVGSIAGIILALIAMRGKKNKGLAKIGLFVSILTMLPWLLVFILGP